MYVGKRLFRYGCEREALACPKMGLLGQRWVASMPCPIVLMTVSIDICWVFDIGSVASMS